MKTNVDDGVIFEALLTDISNAFDCILHDLIIVKLKAHVFHIDALKLLFTTISQIENKEL